MRLTTFTLVLAGVSVPAVANAQFTAMIDGGQRMEKYATGFSRTVPVAGLGLGAALAGGAGQNSGFILSASLEGKIGGSGALDGKFTGDAMMRVGPVAFGGGLDLLAPGVGDVSDPTSPDGKRSISDEQMFGYSGIAKLNFGPLSKGFIQARITTYPSGSGFRLIDTCNSQYLDQSTSATCSQIIAQHDPEFQSGDEARVSTGWVFSGSGGAKILRLQWAQQRLNYVREKDNVGGAYDRTVQTVSLGLVFTL
jgi:hypothetical protein